MRQIVVPLMLWFAMPAMAQHDSITFRTRVANTTTAVCKSQPASRHLYGITKIVPEFVDEAEWDDDMKGAFLYACELWEEVLPTTFPIRVKVRLQPVVSNATAGSIQTEVMLRTYNIPQYSGVWTDNTMATYTEVKGTKYDEQAKGFCSYRFDPILDLRLLTQPEIEITVYQYPNMHDIYTFSIGEDCDSSHYDFVTLIMRCIAKGLGIVCDTSGWVVSGSHTLTVQQSHFLALEDYLAAPLRNTTPAQAYVLATSGQRSFTAEGCQYVFYAPSTWDDDLSLNYLIPQTGSKISQLLRWDYGRGTVVRDISDENIYNIFKKVFLWEGYVTTSNNYSYLEKTDMLTGEYIPYHGTFTFSGNLNSSSSGLSQAVLQGMSSAETYELSDEEYEAMQEYMVQYHPNYAPSGTTDSQGWNLALQKKDGTWDVFTYGQGGAQYGDSYYVDTDELGIVDDGSYARTPDGYLKCKFTYFRSRPSLGGLRHTCLTRYYLFDWLPQKVQLSERRGVDYDDDEYYVRDVIMTMSGLEGANRIIVSQQEEGDPFPFTYEVTDFKSGSFIATVDKELYTTLRVMAINANGTTLSDTYTIAPVLADGLSFNMQLNGSNITMTPGLSRLSSKNLLDSYVIQPVDLTGGAAASAGSRSSRAGDCEGNTIDISGLPRGMYVLKVTDTRGHQHQYKFRKP